jgi:hypothetical protein
VADRSLEPSLAPDAKRPGFFSKFIEAQGLAPEWLFNKEEGATCHLKWAGYTGNTIAIAFPA